MPHVDSGVRLTVDARMIQASGIGTYTRNVLSRVIAMSPDARFSLLGDSNVLKSYSWANSANVDVIHCNPPIYSIREQLDVPRAIPRDSSMFWSVHFNIPLLVKSKLLVTVHDVFFLAMPKYANGLHKRLYASFLCNEARRKASAIICPSEFTRKELLRLTRPGGAEPVVIHEAVDTEWLNVREDAEPHSDKYILFVGNVKPHKNLSTLLNAFSMLLPDIPHDLVIVGKKEGFITGDEAVVTRAESLGDRVRFTGHVDEAALKRYYLNASALVFPSLYEGFGLPPLEAMACGCPVVSSTAASLPEICGDAAVYFDPLNARQMADSIRRVLNDGVLARSLSEKGLSKVKEYSWDRTAQTHIDVINSIAVC